MGSNIFYLILKAVKPLPVQTLWQLNWVSADFKTWISLITQRLAQGGGGRIVTPNPEIVMAAEANPDLKQILSDAEYCLPDGVGIVWASRILGNPIRQRLAGSDTLEALLPIYKGSIFLWGGRVGVADRAGQRISQRYSHVQIAGTASGYYEAAAETDIINLIKQSQARLVLLGLGSPKQELLLQRVYQACPQAWIMTVGGMIDVLAGEVVRAPQLWRCLGMEWLYRGLREPQRLKRWPALLKFVLWVTRFKMKGSDAK